ncbi:MAG: DUF169 domain-containing protein [Candidatus Zhuqueibacterota bacterium]
MQPDPSNVLKVANITYPLIGCYDAPDTAPFEPLVSPSPGKRACTFSFFKSWLNGKTLFITKDNYGCGGAGHWIFDLETRNRPDFIKFLVDEEGLKSSHELMDRWLNVNIPYQAEYGNILIGPLQAEQYPYLKTVTFYVNPDQLSLLMVGAQYNNSPDDPAPVIAAFGAGCMQLLPLFEDLNAPQAMVGATDIAMRQFLPPDILAFTVTRPMFEQLCNLDQRSFLYKPFWQRLQKAREH